MGSLYLEPREDGRQACLFMVVAARRRSSAPRSTCYVGPSSPLLDGAQICVMLATRSSFHDGAVAVKTTT